MQNKRLVVRMLIRGLYAGGIIFLVSGVLLSALSLPVLAAGNTLSSGPAQLQTAETTTDCATCGTATPFMPLQTMTPGGTGPSSLIFTSGCDCSCTTVNTDVCNVGGPMQAAARWDLFFNAAGNPTLGERIKSGSIGPLDAGTCITLDDVPSTAGNYAYVIKQEPNHVGPGTVWSSACLVSGLCFPNTATPTATSTNPVITNTPTSVPTPTDTPTVGLTPTDTPTSGPTPTHTRAPKTINLSAVCDYPSDNFLLWKVANNTGQALDYVWRVVGTAESGSGTVQANANDYFTSSPGSKTVRLFVADELVDSEASVAPCKQDLVLSYTCTPNGLDWSLRNPNNFAVDMRWSFDKGQVFTDVLAAGEVRIIGSTTSGAHNVVVEWMDARPVNHQVTLSSTDASCDPIITPATPTFTATPIASLTPTQTFTLPVDTLTPTATSTQPVNTLTPTPTFTQPVISLTPTSTFTQPVITLIPSLTSTNTQVPPVTITPTHTNTVTATPVNTQGGPPFATSTLTITPTRTRTPTNTNVPTRTNVPTKTNVPTNTPVNTQAAPPLATFTATITPTNTLVPSATITPTLTQIPTLGPPAQVSTPAIIPVTGEDRLAPARTTGLIGQLFINIGLVLFGMALALNGFQKQMRY